MKILRLNNLPEPNSNVVDFILRHPACNVSPEDIKKYPEKKSNLYRLKIQNDIYKNTVNAALCHQIDLIDENLDIIKKQYQPFFSEPIIACWFTACTNVMPELGPAVLAVHDHKVRTVAINYFLELGGDNVQTTFYSIVQNKVGVDALAPRTQFDSYILYEDVNKKGYFISETKKWYAFSSRIPHSVDNIVGCRIFLSFVFDSMFDISDILVENKIKYDALSLNNF